ncbi:hypothetical protein [Paenibacillus alkalitolerans]|uniref:hypothetical protein n=1 Tax=Paenibacillus alkalitolerans TaxID=2799335 RepID=UPI0018F532D4|nr:hypothetical protein [Paenibacillus alkalitolerans]
MIKKIGLTFVLLFLLIGLLSGCGGGRYAHESILGMPDKPFGKSTSIQNMTHCDSQ